MDSLHAKVLSVLMICIFMLTANDRQEESHSEKKAQEQNKKTQVTKALPAPLVIVKHDEVRTIQPGFEFPAVIEAVETAAMKPQVAGVVKSRNITSGSLVQKGDLLMEIDEADYRIKVTEIKASIAQAKAGAAEAAANFERAEKLKAKGYISQGLRYCEGAKSKRSGIDRTAEGKITTF